MSNVPDDWGAYYSTCERCEKKYHPSGTVRCDCEECARCGGDRASDELDESGVCDTCWKDFGACCPECKEWTLDMSMEDGLCPSCTTEGKDDGDRQQESA